LRFSDERPRTNGKGIGLSSLVLRALSFVLHPKDSPLVTALLIALIAALPLLTRPGLPRHTDLELHVFRAAEYRSVLAERPFEYPRWAPDFYYGYGYPIFNYYAPLAYFAASVISIAPGFDIVVAMKAMLVLAFVLASLGMLALARRHYGASAGVVASAVYVLSPYMLFVDPFMRGDAAEFLALGILPWVFWAFDRPLQSPRQIGRAAAVLAALVFSHNLMALIGGAMLAAWLLWRGVFVDGVGRWPRDLTAVLITVGLTAIFWLPFIAERGAVRLDVAGPGHFDFRNHFIDLGTLLRPSPVLDLGATTPHFIYNLGLAQWVLALPALMALRRISGAPARIAVFFLLLSLAFILLITPASQSLWEAAPAAAYIQFPWRFLGPASFTLAMCAACSVSLVHTRPQITRMPRMSFQSVKSVFSVVAFYASRPQIAGPLVLGLTLFAALPTMYPPLWDADFGDPSPRGSIDFELSGVALGTTSTGDFLPHTVAQVPPPAQPVIDAFRNGQSIDRFDYATAPNARVTPVHLSGLDAEYEVASGSAFTARFFVFAFPGWQAMVDGEVVPLRPSSGDGFIQFDVPASARTLGIHFGSTPPRDVGGAISLASLGVVCVLLLLRRPVQPTNYPTIRLSNYLLLAALGFLVLRLVILDRCDTCFRYTSPAGQALAASNEQWANFGNHIELLGFDLPRLEVEAGQVLPLTLYWHATAPVPINYQVFAHLTRPAVVLWGQSDKLNPGDFPSTRWPLDKYVWDDHVIRVLSGTPPGEYTLSVGLYTLGDGRRAPIIDASGSIVGDSVQLSLPVRVIRPSTPPSIDSLGIQTPLDVSVGGLALLGASVEQATLARPNFARVTLFWRAQIDAPASVTVRARMIAENDRVANEIVSPPVGGAYPTSAWRSGEIVRDVYAFWLPPDFLPGRYALRVALAENGEPDISLGEIEVLGP